MDVYEAFADKAIEGFKTHVTDSAITAMFFKANIAGLLASLPNRNWNYIDQAFKN